MQVRLTQSGRASSFDNSEGDVKIPGPTPSGPPFRSALSFPGARRRREPVEAARSGVPLPKPPPKAPKIRGFVPKIRLSGTKTHRFGRKISGLGGAGFYPESPGNSSSEAGISGGRAVGFLPGVFSFPVPTPGDHPAPGVVPLGLFSTTWRGNSTTGRNTETLALGVRETPVDGKSIPVIFFTCF